MKNSNDEPLIHIYVRCSTEEQATTGNSPEAQENTIRNVVALAKLDIESAEWYRDIGVSGFSKSIGERPEGGRMIRAINDGDTVVIAAIDRAFRGAADGIQKFNEWDKRKIRLIVCNMGGMPIDTWSPVGKLLLSQLIVFAEFESQRIGERTKAGFAVVKKRNGGYIPYHIKFAPLGYMFKNPNVKRDEELVLVPHWPTLEVVREIRELSRGGLNQWQIIARYAGADSACKFFRKREKVFFQWEQHFTIAKWVPWNVFDAINGEAFAAEIKGYEEPITEAAWAHEKKTERYKLRMWRKEQQEKKEQQKKEKASVSKATVIRDHDADMDKLQDGGIVHAGA